MEQVGGEIHLSKVHDSLTVLEKGRVVLCVTNETKQ